MTGDTRAAAKMDQTSTTHRVPQPIHHAPARGLPEPQRDHRTLPNNVARNSPRSLFDYASKRCNSNAANSTFEIVVGELRAKVVKTQRLRDSATGGTRAAAEMSLARRAERHSRRGRRAGPARTAREPDGARPATQPPGTPMTTGNAATASSMNNERPGTRTSTGSSRLTYQSSEIGVTP